MRGFIILFYLLLIYVLIFYNKKVKKGRKESGEARMGDTQTSRRNSALQQNREPRHYLEGNAGAGGVSIMQLASPTDREELMMQKKRGTCWSDFLE